MVGAKAGASGAVAGPAPADGPRAGEVTLDGVAIILQGVRILRRPDGLSYVEPPCYRHTDGDMVPAVLPPEELENAIARAVLERAGARLDDLYAATKPRV